MNISKKNSIALIRVGQIGDTITAVELCREFNFDLYLLANKKQLITTRGVILPRPAYDPFAAKTILVNTKGTTTADLKNLNFKNIEREIYPINDPVFDIKVNNV